MRVWAAFRQVASDWPHPVLAQTLRLAAQNRRIKRRFVDLDEQYALHLRNDEKDRRRYAAVVYERDEALQLIVDLRHEVAALEKVNQLLMETAPSDARGLGEAS